MLYDAITIDTQVVSTNGYALEGGLLEQLKQFKNGPVKVVLSDIVVREIYKHLLEKTKEAKDKLMSAQRNALEFGLIEANAATFEADSAKVDAAVRFRLNRFLNEIGAEIVTSDNVKTSDLVRRYFSAQPPFSKTGKKKNEFPDAIALMALESWANAKGKMILAVSGDQDWGDFADESDRIDLKSDLASALALLQVRGDQAQAIVQKLLLSISNGEDASLTQTFERLLESEVGGYHVFAEAESIGHVETDQVDLTYESSEFLGNDEEFDFVVVQDDSNTIVARLNLVLHVLAEASFSISVHDSIDDDYVGIGSTSASANVDVEASVLVTFEGDRETADYEVTRVVIVSGPQTIDFGYIAPEYEDEYEPDLEPPEEPEYERPEIEDDRPERDESEHR